MTKTRIGIFFGGKSAEHEVSIMSARNVLEAIDGDQFDPVLIGIARDGSWHHVSVAELVQNQSDTVILDSPAMQRFTAVDELGIEAAFPIIHGPMGEDGTLQGFFELADIPYVGPGVLASAACMDKDATKRLLRDAGISVAPYIVLRQGDTYDANLIQSELGNVVFVKPANMGSSVGVTRADSVKSIDHAIMDAFQYDSKILIESAVAGDEIECAVLGNEAPEASVIGRIIPTGDNFYDYDTKYIDESGAILEMPADIDQQSINKAQATALLAYRALGCEGLSRVDMFLKPDGNIVVNEINTIPGFTNISMYPKLWELSGVQYSDLITRLIRLAQQRHDSRSAIKTLR